MLKAEIEELRLYLSRIRPIYHQLFNLAHAITGNCDQAEYCLQYAMLDGWAAGDAGASRHGFRESVRASAVRAAMRIALSGEAAEFDWDGLRSANGDDPVEAAIAQEGAELRRLLALCYGCGLSLRRIARATHSDSRRARAMLRRFEARVRRKLPAAQQRRCEARIHQTVRKLMSQPCPLAPDMASAFRTFQADAAAMSRPSRLPSRILRAALALLLAIFCVSAFWLAAVLLQPPALETPDEVPAAVETAQP